MSPRRLLVAAALLALGGPTALLVAPAGAAPATGSGAGIDHAQPTDEGVKLLVTVPATGEVDPAGVAVSIGGTGVDSTAELAASTDDVRRTTILAIDTSDSMRGARIEAARTAAETYLSTVPANVEVGVVSFDADVQVLVPPTIDRGRARAAVANLRLTRSTALYDGVLGALEALGPDGDDAGQRSVLVLSDGKDTTDTSLSTVVKAVRDSGAQLDVVSLDQGGEAAQPLQLLAQAGRGEVIDASGDSLTTAFRNEADALARQLVVTAEVPGGTSTSEDVTVEVPVDGVPVTASAYLPVRASASTAPREDPTPQAAGPVAALGPRFELSQLVVYGGVGAIGLGLVGLVSVMAFAGPSVSKDDKLRKQLEAYGVFGAPTSSTGSPQAGPGSLGQSATHAAESVLAGREGLEEKIAASLNAAGMSLKPAEWLLLHAGTTVGAGALGLLLGRGNVLVGLLLLALGAVAPRVYLSLRRARRIKAFSTNLPDTLQLMAGSLSAGLSLAQSIDTIVKEGGEPIATEFRRVIVESRLGVTLEDSMEGVGERMQSKDFAWVVMAIRIQREVGGNLAELLLQVAATLREREYLRRHVRALSAEGRLSAWVLGGLPPGFLGYLTLAKPDYVMVLYTTPVGWVLLGVMALLLTVGVLWMAKVGKVDV
ncbi:tight adherence protein B [Nocardioides scoriae]|uniref:Tight adherence protein B n=1 Tax=Nocardioides scoriae TaxID=642780 RepID=A0A1H1MK93_9ACTN|nr:type II secretion system F family protein [Nocardioides scoriae]SDR87274.1 tight adherence protein B [Nocardioides scoriae]